VPPRARPLGTTGHQPARVPQTVPPTARSGWARIAVGVIDEVLAAPDREHGAGVPSAVDALMALPAEVLADGRESWGQDRRIERRIQRLEDSLALDPAPRTVGPDDSSDAPAHRSAQGPGKLAV
jgi:hypothetical protein